MTVSQISMACTDLVVTHSWGSEVQVEYSLNLDLSIVLVTLGPEGGSPRTRSVIFIQSYQGPMLLARRVTVHGNDGSLFQVSQ